jgi:hypothetical protein
MVYYRTVTASPPHGGSDYTKPCSGLRPLHGFVTPHFFVCKTATQFSYSKQKNVSYLLEKKNMGIMTKGEEKRGKK